MKRGLWLSVLLTISCMVGAGILIIPSELMHYGFHGIMGWFLAAFCSLALGRIFAANAVSSDNVETVAESVKSVFGSGIGFRVATMQCLYMCIAVTAVLRTMINYLKDFVPINDSLFSLTMGAVTIIACFLFIIIQGHADWIAAIATIVKLFFFSLTSLIGIITFSKAKFFHLDSVSSAHHTLELSVFILYIALMGAILAVRWRKEEANSGQVALAIKVITSIFLLFILYENLDLVKQSLMNDKESIFSSIKKITASATIALFAYAGLEFAAASPNDVISPKTNIPAATFIGITIASIVFISTHLCAVNNSIDISSQKPVQLGLCNFIEQIASKLSFSSSNIELISVIVSRLIGMVAVIGCCGTCIAIQKSVSGLFSEMVYEFVINKNSRQKERVKFISFFIIAALIILFYIAIFYAKDVMFGLLNFSIIHTYFYGALVSIKKTKNIFLSITGLTACLILLSGCNAEAVFLGVVLHFTVDGIFVLMQRYTKSELIKNIEKVKK